MLFDTHSRNLNLVFNSSVLTLPHILFLEGFEGLYVAHGRRCSPLKPGINVLVMYFFQSVDVRFDFEILLVLHMNRTFVNK